jgi:hypothetical protein
MNKRLFLIFSLMMALNSFAIAQKECARVPVTATALPKSTNPAMDEQEHPYGGTFQLICSKDAKKEIFTTELLKLVEKNRLEDTENILVLSPVTRVRILSKKQIAASDFQPIQKLYSFE